MARLFYLFIFVVLISEVKISYSQQYCISGRFDTTYSFAPNQIDTIGGITYGQNTDWQGNNIVLKFIIAYPRISIDPLSKRPFILLIHGGGFIDGDKYDMKPVMLDFAMRGCVCASIDYRIGWQTNGNPLNCLGDGYSLAKANYRALQDSKAALRFFAANANQYKIDTACFFVGGISAGAVSCLMISYANQQDINSVYPNLRNELGSLDSSTNGFTNPFTIKTLLSSSGGVYDTTFIKSSTKIPAIMFHGTADLEVPYNTGYSYSCTNYIRTEGSNEINKRLRHLVKPFELDYVPGGGHENFYPLAYIQLRSILFLKRYLCNDSRQVIIENYTTIRDTILGFYTRIVSNNNTIPGELKLYQNYPNPFNPLTVIRYLLTNNSNVHLNIYDLTGKEIITLENGEKSAGNYDIKFDGTNLSSGVYFYKLEVNDARNGNVLYKDIKKMLLIK